MIKIKKLDKRNVGYSYWKYYVQLSVNNKNDRINFCKMCEWCWAHWGPSKEVNSYDNHDLFDDVSCSNSRWCWQNDSYCTRIYLRDDSESIAFSLKWI
jgi:hypothetical protein